MGEERVAAGREAALDVVAACGFLPLAIRIAAARIAAARLATTRTWTVSALARKLADEGKRLDELRVGELAVTATFDQAYRCWTRFRPALRLLALPQGNDISLAAAAAVLGMDEHDTEQVLESLVDISLLESAAPGRYRYDDLLRLYARQRVEQEEPAEMRAAAMSRLLDFYLAAASRAYALESPGLRLLDHLAATGQPGIPFDQGGEALDWTFSEAAYLLAAVQQAAAEPGLLRRATDLLLVVQNLMESGAYVSSARRRPGASSRMRVHEDWCSVGRARAVLGQVYCLTGQFAEADRESKRALVAGLAAEDLVTCAYAPNLRGMVALYRKRYKDAEEYFTQALTAFRDDGNRQGEGSALSNFSRARLGLGQAQGAVEAAEQGSPSTASWASPCSCATACPRSASRSPRTTASMRRWPGSARLSPCSGRAGSGVGA